VFCGSKRSFGAFSAVHTGRDANATATARPVVRIRRARLRLMAWSNKGYMGCWNVSVENQNGTLLVAKSRFPAAVTEIPCSDGAGFAKTGHDHPLRTEKRPIETASCNTRSHRSQDTRNLGDYSPAAALMIPAATLHCGGAGDRDSDSPYWDCSYRRRRNPDSPGNA